MPDDRLAYGAAGEQQALDYLKTRGLTLLARNVRTPYGELDLLMQDGPVRVAVEVKARRGTHFGVPQEAVNRRKLEHITAAATHHFVESGYTGPWRIDVVAITDERLEHFRNVTLA